MTNTKKLYSLVVAAFLLAACGSSNSTKASTSSSTSSTSSSTTTSTSSTTTTFPGVVPAVGRQSYVKTIASPSLLVNISYPELGGMASSSVEANINAAVKAAVKGYVSNFEKSLEEQGGYHPPSGSQSNPSQISGSFTTTLIDPRYASFKFMLTSFATGAASSYSQSPAVTFDLNTGQLLTLGNLFATSAYLTSLSNLSRTQLTSKLGGNNSNLVDGGTQPNASNFSEWDLTSSGLQLSFPQGQVAAAASGVISIVIPYSQLSGIAKRPGPLTNH